MLVVKKIIETTSTNFMIDGNDIKIKTTAGVVIYPDYGENKDELFHFSTLALLHAEKENKSYAFFQSSMSKLINTKHILLKEIQESIKSETIEILYRPVISLKNEEIIEIEATPNFKHEVYGEVNSDYLFTLVEKTNLDTKLMKITINNAIKNYSNWHKKNEHIGLKIDLLTVNDHNLVQELEELLRKHDIPADKVTLMFTEKACLSDQVTSSKVISQLVKMGIRISIKDFATGFASFNYLTNFPINEIQIDKSYIKNMIENKNKYKLVEVIISVARTLNLTLSASGIEDEKTLAALIQLGCKKGSGELFYPLINAKRLSGIFEQQE